MGKHGYSSHPIYKRWEGMNQRINNKNNPVYKYYGGRGIKICDEWKEYLPFHRWAINNGFSENLELDRIDSNGNYEPSNCRWVDGLTNRRNVQKRKRNKKANWGIRKTYNKKYIVQIWDNETKKINRYPIVNTLEEAIQIREKALIGEIKPFERRADKGIYLTKNGTYLVHVVKNKKCYHVGCFKSKDEALLKRDEFIKALC